ncbi:MAG: 50S ribosomal protein L28 [Patescibacteria group bacterium]
MSRRCSICGRQSQRSISRSHSMVATKRWQNLNLITKKVAGKKIKICSKCLKTLKRK